MAYCMCYNRGYVRLGLREAGQTVWYKYRCPHCDGGKKRVKKVSVEIQAPAINAAVAWLESTEFKDESVRISAYEKVADARSFSRILLSQLKNPKCPRIHSALQETCRLKLALDASEREIEL